MTYSKDVPGFVANGLLMPFINEVRGVTHTLSRVGAMLIERLTANAQAIMMLERVIRGRAFGAMIV